MNDFAGKVAFVTGAGLGLGRGLAGALAEQGAIVAANDLTTINMEETAATVRAQGGEFAFFLGDVSKKLALQTLVLDIVNAYGRIDILVNHASVQPHHPILDMDEWDWRRTVDVNLTGTFLSTQVVGRVMRETGGGVILNVGPSAPDQFSPPRAAYLAAKAGVLAFTQAAAAELSEYNIKVNAICPPAVNPNDGLGQAAQVVQALALCRSLESGQIIEMD